MTALNFNFVLKYDIFVCHRINLLFLVWIELFEAIALTFDKHWGSWETLLFLSLRRVKTCQNFTTCPAESTGSHWSMSCHLSFSLVTRWDDNSHDLGLHNDTRPLRPWELAIIFITKQNHNNNYSLEPGNLLLIACVPLNSHLI